VSGGSVSARAARRAAPVGWLPGARVVASPHHDARPDPAAVDLLVVHHISLPPGQFHGDAIERLFTGTLDPTAHPFFASIASLRVSAHFLIRRRGELTSVLTLSR
jgi:AmpD protein